MEKIKFEQVSKNFLVRDENKKGHNESLPLFKALTSR